MQAMAEKLNLIHYIESILQYCLLLCLYDKPCKQSSIKFFNIYRN